VITNPRALRQQMPPWPATAGSRQGTGAVRVTIGEDGRVKKVSIDRRLHPAYDLQLLAAARSWTYQPATLNGRPVQVDLIVEVAP
jgi:TonB family protein